MLALASKEYTFLSSSPRKDIEISEFYIPLKFMFLSSEYHRPCPEDQVTDDDPVSKKFFIDSRWGIIRHKPHCILSYTVHALILLLMLLEAGKVFGTTLFFGP